MNTDQPPLPPSSGKVMQSLRLIRGLEVSLSVGLEASLRSLTEIFFIYLFT